MSKYFTSNITNVAECDDCDQSLENVHTIIYNGQISKTCPQCGTEYIETIMNL